MRQFCCVTPARKGLPAGDDEVVKHACGVADVVAVGLAEVVLQWRWAWLRLSCVVSSVRRPVSSSTVRRPVSSFTAFQCEAACLLIHSCCCYDGGRSALCPSGGHKGCRNSALVRAGRSWGLWSLFLLLRDVDT
jgi:hypothetical protein